MSWSRRIPFRVNVAGIIELMGRSLYSRGDTAVRELIQNAHDAVSRRKASDLSFQPRIDIVQDRDEGTLTVSDNGVGLSEREAEEYLGTVGLGLTGLMRNDSGNNDALDLIGQFGVGLLSSFMLADRIDVTTRKEDCEAVCWRAGTEADIELSSAERVELGTTITLHLRSDQRTFAENEDALESSIREFADYLQVPIFLNHSTQRVNVINAAWFDPTPDPEAIELALEEQFSETPLDVIPIRIESPVSVAGTLYVTPQRVPGFSSEPTLMITVRRMIISRRHPDLLPDWAGFVRGVLELHDCSPTTSRESLVRDSTFAAAQSVIEDTLFGHFEDLVQNAPDKWQAVLQWHRYLLTGAALDNERLRGLLRQSYTFPTSRGAMTFDEIAEASPADPLFEDEADRVIWINSSRRQEASVNQHFAGSDVPCVHALRVFEESLLATFAADDGGQGQQSDLRFAGPSAKNFDRAILGIHDLEDAAEAWQMFLRPLDVHVRVGDMSASVPVMAFVNDDNELAQTFEGMKKDGRVPPGFQRLIDQHFDETVPARNEVILNRRHRLIGRALEQSTKTPLAGVLRLLVMNALTSAGARFEVGSANLQSEDLDWVAEALWGRDH